METRKVRRNLDVSGRHPRPAESMRLIEQQNARNGAVKSAPTLQEQLSKEAAAYAAANASLNAKIRRGV